MSPNQINSKKRVNDHGEVFTAESEVNAMLDLVKYETDRIESRFLEPACGNGNFLVPILEKKLAIVRRKYARSQLEFERYAILAIGSVYGIDILYDNVSNCRRRLFAIFDKIYLSLFKNKCKESYRSSVRLILRRNILHGDALSLKTVGEKVEPIVFSKWSLARGSMMKRHDYVFSELMPKDVNDQNLFDESRISDLGIPGFIPTAIKEFPLVHFLTLSYEPTS
jgi:hypothetical protein